ncbi:unnamed protein product, partial [Meganyctiphanes norvegica]
MNRSDIKNLKVEDGIVIGCHVCGMPLLLQWRKSGGRVEEGLVIGSHSCVRKKRINLKKSGSMGRSCYWQSFMCVSGGRSCYWQSCVCHVCGMPPAVRVEEGLVIGSHVCVIHVCGKPPAVRVEEGLVIGIMCVVGPVLLEWRKVLLLAVIHVSVAAASLRCNLFVRGEPKRGTVTSRLYVANVSPSDSGIYACVYGNGRTRDTVAVHVIAGENSAAMQHDAVPTSLSTAISSAVSTRQTNRLPLMVMAIVPLWLAVLSWTRVGWCSDVHIPTMVSTGQKYYFFIEIFILIR